MPIIPNTSVVRAPRARFGPRLNWRPRTRAFELGAAALFCLAALAIVIDCLSDYSINWMHPEIFGAETSHLSGLTQLHWIDVTRFFGCQLLSDVCARARFLSYLTGFVDSFFRLWLVQYIPPHPSLNVTWLLSFASLYCLYRTIVLITDDRPAALLAVGLYALSAGFLSNMLMLFNPAKPLAGFFVNFCLMLAAQIWRSRDHRVYSPAALLLYVALFLAYSSDETSWFLCCAIPLLFVDLWRRRGRALLAAVVASFPLFLAFVTWAAPPIIMWLWGYRYSDFWSLAFDVGRAATPNELPLLDRLDAGTLAATAYSMVKSEYSWWRSGPTLAALSLVPIVGGLAAAALIAEPWMRRLFIRATAVFLLFVLFECLILLRAYIASGTYYYGALFANYSLLMVGVAIACVRRVPAARIVAFLAAVYLGYVSFSWCMATNRSWIARHDQLYAEMIGDRYGPLTPGAPLSEAKVAVYARAAMAWQDLRGLRATFAPKDVWLFEELEAWRRRHEKRQ